jgi:hypothetical protein
VSEAHNPDWDPIIRRHEAWWACEAVDRPVVMVTAPKRRSEVSRPAPEDALDWFTNPERVLARIEEQVANTYYAGDALPVVYPVSISLVAILAAYVGCPYHVHADSMTGWADPFLANMEARPRLAFDPTCEWWRISARLLKAAGAQAQGRYLLGVPDLNGPGEILARARGTEPLALDCVERPEEVKRARAELDQAWREAWQAATGLVQRWQQSYSFWMGIWSSQPASDLQCDFSVMLSPRMVEELFLPGIEQQTQWVERSIYHLDGPEEIRFLDALLALPRLNAIQWVPLPQKSSPLDWLPLLQRIQRGGKALWIAAAPSDIERLLAELRPEGLMIRTSCATPAEADELMAQVPRWAARR